jgi:NADPH:quinone reductase-like Zn-dependent oxidoreductase
MRAIVVDGFGPPERLHVGEVAEPVPGPDEVLVMVHAAPVNYVDLLVVGGSYQFLPPLPFIPGNGPAGVVTALGREVTSLRAGDRVLAMTEQGQSASTSIVTRPPPTSSRAPEWTTKFPRVAFRVVPERCLAWFEVMRPADGGA